jgi:hypothetical protein
VVAYTSAKLSKAERNYTTTEQELLGIVCALEEWRCYLEGAQRTVKIVTDHNPLTYLREQKTLSRRLVRWVQFMARFDHVILYKPGSGNVADPVSRHPGLQQQGDGPDMEEVVGELCVCRDGYMLALRPVGDLAATMVGSAAATGPVRRSTRLVQQQAGQQIGLDPSAELPPPPAATDARGRALPSDGGERPNGGANHEQRDMQYKRKRSRTKFDASAKQQSLTLEEEVIRAYTVDTGFHPSDRWSYKDGLWWNQSEQIVVPNSRLVCTQISVHTTTQLWLATQAFRGHLRRCNEGSGGAAWLWMWIAMCVHVMPVRVTSNKLTS